MDIGTVLKKHFDEFVITHHSSKMEACALICQNKSSGFDWRASRTNLLQMVTAVLTVIRDIRVEAWYHARVTEANN